MAKTTRQGGPSFTPEEEEGLEYVPTRVRRAEVGAMRRDEKKGDKSSPGNNSTASTSEQSTLSGKPRQEHQEPAPATDNPSSVSTATNESADSADGSTPETEKGSNKAPRKASTATKKTGTARSTNLTSDDF